MIQPSIIVKILCFLENLNNKTASDTKYKYDNFYIDEQNEPKKYSYNQCEFINKKLSVSILSWYPVYSFFIRWISEAIKYKVILFY